MADPRVPEETRITPRPYREEQAWEEIGHTAFAPGVAHFLVAVFLLVIVGVPSAQFLIPDAAYARLAEEAEEEDVGARPGVRRITATVAAVSDPPDPHGVYAEHLMRLHLVDVDGLEVGECRLAVLAMRDHRVRPIAEVAAGMRIEAEVRSWDEVAANYEGTDGSNLEGDSYLTMPAFFADRVAIKGRVGPPGATDFLAVWAGRGAGLPADARVGTLSGTARAWREEGNAFDAFLAANAHLAERIDVYESALDDDALLALWLRAPVQDLMVGLGVGNEQAYVGRDGWLFYAPGVRACTGRGFLDPDHLALRARAGDYFERAPEPDPRPAILDFRRRLAERGIELVVVPTPVKPTIHPEMLSARADPARTVRNRSFESFVDDLRAEGVRVYDPAPLLMRRKAEGGAQYLATDTHWRPGAVAAVADELAATIAGDLEGEPAAGYHRVAERVANFGDVARMLELPAGQDRFDPETVRLPSVRDAGGEGWRPDPRADVLVLGDSFSNIYHLPGMGWGAHGGFAAQLAAALDRPVDLIARNDAGAHASRAELVELLGGPDPHRLVGKKVVVWQFAERELALGDWKVLGFPPAPEAPPASGPGAGIAIADVDDPAAARAAFARVAGRVDDPAFAGIDDWLFRTSEIAHLAHGPFWGEHASGPEADPLRAIVDLKDKLAELGIELVFAPAPPRAAIYPDKIFARVPVDEDGVPRRVDHDLRAFYDALRAEGITVVDLTDAFLAARRDGGEPVCCEQDTHWSPRGLVIAARSVAAAFRDDAWLRDVEPDALHHRDPELLTYVGDLVDRVPGHPLTESRATIRRITEDPAGRTPLAFDPESPVLLLADSHGLVFSTGDDMHATAAGFGEHLAAELGIRIDRMARRGSGALVRADLARRFIQDPAAANPKRVLIYTFAARTLTGSDRWKPVPLRR